MPKSKNPEAYPYAYRAVLEHVDKEGELIQHFDTKEEAKRVQFDMYGFKAALAHHGDKLAVPAARVVLRVEVNLGGGYDLRLTSSLDDDINRKFLETITRAQKQAPANPGGETSVAPDLTTQPDEVKSLEPEGDAGEAMLASLGFGTEFNQGGEANIEEIINDVPIKAPAVPIHRSEGWRQMKGLPPYGVDTEIDKKLDKEHGEG